MGFRVSGIAINKNYQNDLDGLAKALHWNLGGTEEAFFENAYNIGDEELNIYFCPTGTLIFVGTDFALQKYDIPNQKCVSFVLMENEGMCSLQATENGKEIRNYVDTGGRFPEMEEDFFDEFEFDNDSEVFGAIKDVLGKSYFDIEAEEPVLHITWFEEA